MWMFYTVLFVKGFGGDSSPENIMILPNGEKTSWYSMCSLAFVWITWGNFQGRAQFWFRDVIAGQFKDKGTKEHTAAL